MRCSVCCNFSCHRLTNQPVMPRYTSINATLRTTERDKLTAHSPAELFSASAWKRNIDTSRRQTRMLHHHLHRFQIRDLCQAEIYMVEFVKVSKSLADLAFSNARLVGNCKNDARCAESVIASAYCSSCFHARASNSSVRGSPTAPNAR